ncbi:MAG: bifunctional riboflavin kinase/FAD synthetase [Sphaerobacteraceae bacterium]|nr:MAG: bifunctional riboflavin kinase/FAD synthetase [Sphaerobacteraceae bacterium]
MNSESSIFRSLAELPGDRHVVTVGSFDGVHRGHQYLIQQVAEHASRLNASALGVTFDPHPAEVLRPDKAPSRVCTTSVRTQEMLTAGLDRVAVLEFDHQMANQSADDFLSELVAATHPAGIIIGEDFAFGHKRQGTPEFLRERADQYGYELTIVSRVNPDSQVEWSSSFIRRELAQNGNVRSAADALGRLFSLSGTVGDGEKRGRELGYPTANLRPPEGLIIPADGIYAALVDVNDEINQNGLPCLVYVGKRPTFDNDLRVIEVYILDFDADLYSRNITVHFIELVRPDRAFDSADELVQQMHNDEVSGRRILSEFGANVSTTPGN